MGDAIIMIRGKSKNPVQSFAITALPNKTKYMEAEALDLTGVVVTATFTDGTQMVVTDRCTFTPENGASLYSEDASVEVGWKYSGRIYTATMAITVKSFADITWANGTDDEIIAVVSAARAGKINLKEMWNVGDKRTITVSSMSAVSASTSTHAEQQINIAITEFGGKTLGDGSECLFQWDFVESLAEKGYMNNPNTSDGGYDASPRSQWCDNICFYALPVWLQNISRPFYMTTSAGYNSNKVNTTIHKLGLRTEKEVIGANTYSYDDEAAANNQISYYVAQENKIKKLGINGVASNWWTASSSRKTSVTWVNIYTDGSSNYYTTSSGFGIAPYGCV